MQPEIIDDALVSTEIKMLGGVFVKSFRLPDAGMTVFQHSHAYDHVSVLVKGAIQVWREGEPARTYQAPVGITILAHVKHKFVTLTEDTIILCVHDIDMAEAVEVEELHMPGDV